MRIRHLARAAAAAAVLAVALGGPATAGDSELCIDVPATYASGTSKPVVPGTKPCIPWF